MLRIARSNPTSPRKRGEVSQTSAPIKLKAIVLQSLVSIESKRGSRSCFDAFSSREPVSTSLENALTKAVVPGRQRAGERQCGGRIDAARDRTGHDIGRD